MRPPLILELLAAPQAVAEVRRALRAHMGGPCADLQLCASELITNVIRHLGEGVPVTVRLLRAARGRTRLEVADPDPRALPVLYVVDGTAYLKQGAAPWKDAPASDPGMSSKIEDPVAVVEEFRAYTQAATGDEVGVTEADGTVELRVGSDKQKLTAVQDRAWVKKAVREFAPTAEQLRTAGIAVNDAQLTLSGLEEVLLLDAKTYRVKSHHFEFGFLVPYGGQDITFEQDVRQENQGPFAGRIELPADVR